MTCKNGHLLHEFQSDRAVFLTCNRCDNGKAFNVGEKIFACHLCRFDLCKPCYLEFAPQVCNMFITCFVRQRMDWVCVLLAQTANLEQLVIWRSAGEIMAFNNYCWHRLQVQYRRWLNDIMKDILLLSRIQSWSLSRRWMLAGRSGKFVPLRPCLLLRYTNCRVSFGVFIYTLAKAKLSSVLVGEFKRCWRFDEYRFAICQKVSIGAHVWASWKQNQCCVLKNSELYEGKGCWLRTWGNIKICFWTYKYKSLQENDLSVITVHILSHEKGK